MLDSTKEYWSMVHTVYFKEAIKTVKTHLCDAGILFHSSEDQPLYLLSYCLKINDSPFCEDNHVVLYQHMIGILRLLIKLGWINVCFKVSTLLI